MKQIDIKSQFIYVRLEDTMPFVWQENEKSP